MTTKKRKRRKTYRRRRSLGLAGLSTSKLSAKNATNELLDVALIAIVAAKGVGMLDKAINKSDSKMMGYVAPAVVTAAGVDDQRRG